jgi:hypothetical protein
LGNGLPDFTLNIHYDYIILCKLRADLMNYLSKVWIKWNIRQERRTNFAHALINWDHTHWSTEGLPHPLHRSRMRVTTSRTLKLPHPYFKYDSFAYQPGYCACTTLSEVCAAEIYASVRFLSGILCFLIRCTVAYRYHTYRTVFLLITVQLYEICTRSLLPSQQFSL